MTVETGLYAKLFFRLKHAITQTRVENPGRHTDENELLKWR
jgi:hypothetical protein